VCEVSRASNTKKNDVKDDFLGLQALAENLTFFFRGLLVSRPCVFTVLNLNEVYIPHVDIKLMDSAHISAGLSWV